MVYIATILCITSLIIKRTISKFPKHLATRVRASVDGLFGDLLIVDSFQPVPVDTTHHDMI